MTRLKVGFIGLGDQGAPMAEALMERHDLFIWARRAEAVKPFETTGATIMETAKAVAQDVEVLCLCLPGDSELETLLWEDGLATALRRGAVVINHATGDPQRAVAISGKLTSMDLAFLDAPVSGGRPGAVARSLTCFVGGDAETLANCEAIIACHSKAIRLMGKAGARQMTKLLNNALTVSNLRNLVEVFGLAAQAGLDLVSLQDALATSSGGSFMAQAVGKQITRENAAHIAGLNRKDVNEFNEAMEHLGLDAHEIVNWAMKGPDGLADLAWDLDPRQVASA
ncbi:3-hydroxyisobutyrate dehydrogenase-like beta-hydroxyacid dehydrogenase [Rhizobium sp. SJZ105]|uniref:NAD(P)-dependent oxidoreductase n=1 Tax=Rhizobium sp. SJZ105 TaxID=2572678 RepID=UPI0011AACAF2|nr:NAD(P)-dependent oxidoreductase [Rhizobium sp. SJZ105]TWC77277.1 3-hydroxyisobutyrate dehydrogenase-like beta-hydroxyacid dehydrogenase [Rhizobium sp. SJZ105]